MIDGEDLRESFREQFGQETVPAARVHHGQVRRHQGGQNLFPEAPALQQRIMRAVGIPAAGGEMIPAASAPSLEDRAPAGRVGLELGIA